MCVHTDGYSGFGRGVQVGSVGQQLCAKGGGSARATDTGVRRWCVCVHKQTHSMHQMHITGRREEEGGEVERKEQEL